MANKHTIFQRDNIGWFVEIAGQVEGPLESRDEALNLAHLMQTVTVARSSEVACTEQECFQ